MNFFSWIEQARNLSSVALTVRAQTISPNDNGQLRWDAVMPRTPIPSVDLSEVTTIDFRPVAEFREWNAPARKMALEVPKLRDISINPIEISHDIGEKEMQKLMERTLGNQEVFRQIVSADLPERIRQMTLADYRRIEIAVFSAWANGTVVIRNGLDNTNYTVSYGFDASRYTTAATVWTDPGVNAYTELLNWLRSVATDLIGPIGGVMLRQTTLNAIQADAPNPLSFNAAVPPTVAQIEQRIQDELGQGFRFVVNESTTQPYTGAGIARTKTKTWPAGKVAAIPADGPVGQTGFAPVLRAFELAAVQPDAGIDINGVTAYRVVQNEGKSLKVDVQVNAFPLPNEQRIAVIDTLVP